MKKWILGLAFGLVLSLGAQAQQMEDGGGRPQMSKEQRQAMQRVRLTKSLGISDAAADSVIAINNEQRDAKMNLARDNSMDNSVKEARFEEMRQARRLRLKKVMTDAQIDSLDKQEAEMRNRRQDRRMQ